MAISIDACILILKEHHLLKSSAIQDTLPLKMTYASYDSRKVEVDTLFFCKGKGFRPTYLTMAKSNGAVCYVAEQPYPEGNGMHALIVRDVQKAMAVLSAAFYEFPQDDLYVVAFTGTKGKTTSAYFLKGIFDQVNDGHTALFSSVDRIVGTKPEDRFKSDLTTPESLDLFRDMRKAVDNDMTHLVMEVSSQAYKKNRVFGLTYDLGFFLNISPDHIGPNEHPDYEDYLHSKLQLMVNSRKCIINAQTNNFKEVYAAARITTNPDSVYLFSSADFVQPENAQPIDFMYKSLEADMKKSEFELQTMTPKAKELAIAGKYELSLIGDFNELNATAAIIAAGLNGVTHDQAYEGIRDVRIPGRMQTISTKDHGEIVVDYAHNLASLDALLSFLKREFNDPKISVVIGAPGDKGVSRRADFSKVINEYANVVYLTTDDPGYEDPADIAEEINVGINHDKVDVKIELDRIKAIEMAIAANKPGEILVLAGKGEDKMQKVRGVDTPYESDLVIAKDIVETL